MQSRGLFRKICSRREEIAQEITRVQAVLLRDVKPFRLEGEGSESSADDRVEKNGEDHSPDGGE